MRIIVFFDLPTLTSTQQKTYRDFRKFLIKNGFYMMQESVYCRIQTNSRKIYQMKRFESSVNP